MGQVHKGLGAALAHKGHVLLPGLLPILQGQGVELQAHHLGHAVVDIVEGVQVDVQLPLPASAPAVEGQAVKVDIGAVAALQLQPLLVALLGVISGWR